MILEGNKLYVALIHNRNGNGMREWAKMYLPDTSLGLFKALPAYVLVALANYFH